ncbi:MAG: hypothetical protein KDD26_04245 [Winogradskyella sp.]|nr:hypothetical protein [Winogradskyella sp.]
MKSIALKVLSILCFVNLSKAQSIDDNSSKEFDFYFKSVLAEDRDFIINLSTKMVEPIIDLERLEDDYSYKDYNFDVSGLDFSLQKLTLNDRIDFNNPNNFLLYCAPLENGIYQNFESKNILIGSGVDHFFNDIIIKNVLNRKSLLRKE